MKSPRNKGLAVKWWQCEGEVVDQYKLDARGSQATKILYNHLFFM